MLYNLVRNWWIVGPTINQILVNTWWFIPFVYKKKYNYHFEIQIDINLSFCMPQRISNKKSGLLSEKLKCDVFIYLANQYKIICIEQSIPFLN